MKSLSQTAQIYIVCILLVGAGLLGWQLSRLNAVNPWLLLVTCVIAAILQTLKTVGATTRSSYNLSWILYGFAFILLGAPATLLIILIAHLVEWIWHRYPWYIQTFNIASFAVVVSFSGFVYVLLNPEWTPLTFQGALAVLLAMAVFTGFNHLLVGLVIQLARGQSLAESGVFGIMTLLIDSGSLSLGAVAALLWLVNPYAIVLVFFVTYLLHSALKVPALQRQVETDPKTELFNARHFTEKLKEELARAQRFDRPLIVVMADLDLLREVNNKYGHLAGDIVLKGVADILKESSRDYDLAARFGGEEFAILMPETTLLEAQLFIEEMRFLIETAEFVVSTSATPIKVKMSFGIRECCAKDLSSDDLIHRADIAVYQAKLNGRNQVCIFTSEKNENGNLPVAAPAKMAEPGGGHKTTAPVAAQMDEMSKVAASTPSGSTYPTAPPPSSVAHSAWLLSAYIGGTIALALGLALGVAFFTSVSDWSGILLFTCLALLTEALGIEIYVRNTSVSTSAAPLLAGVLLFGPIAALSIGPAIAIVAYFKYRSPIIRFFFNTSNHLIGGLLSAGLIFLSGNQFSGWPPPIQFVLTVISAFSIYLSTTVLVAVAISIDKHQPLRVVWLERFRWLGPYYAALGVVAYALVFSYHATGLSGVLVILVPLLMLRYSQMQYVNHTETMVTQLRTQNAELTQQAEEISLLNEEMLNVLSNALDLRDPYVLKHSYHVAQYSALIAKELGLGAARIEMVRKGGLLHDIGKLGIPEAVLYKPSRLTDQEYELVKEHVHIGADLIRACHSLYPITPFILYHHEHYNGKGYPEGLVGTAIPLEARILGLADAIEAMASDRPYHRAMDVKEIIIEIKRCSGTQFDPAIVDAFIRILEHEGQHLIVNSARFVQPKRSEPIQLFVKQTTDELPVLVI